MSDDLPQLDARHLQVPDLIQLEPKWPSSHPPRILLLYGSLLTRDRSHYLTSRYSERKEDAAKLEERVALNAI